MSKKDLAARFFTRLSQDPGEFVTQMIETEMDPALVELLNQFGGQLKLGDMEPDRFQASLLIIGYLVRAFEDAHVATPAAPEPTGRPDENGSSLH